MVQQMIVVLLSFLLCLLASSLASPLLHQPSQPDGEEGVVGVWRPVYQMAHEWHDWKSQHKRRYISDSEELERHLVWVSNMKYIEGHNANEHMFGYRLSMNQYGDMTDLEYKTKILTYRRGNTSSAMPRGGLKITPHVPDPNLQLPETLDWRSRGAVTAVKDQGSCGSSYAFSTTGSIEGTMALGYGRLVSLSEQNIVDCSVPLGNNGCNGGNMYNSFMYIIDNEGIDTSYTYPYQGSQMGCSFDRGGVGADITGIIGIREGSEYHLQTALASAGPISVAVDGSTNSFRFYDGGVFDSFRCSSTDVNHAMTLIGYGSYNGKEYWMVKNSWGTSWGMSGYVMMTRNYYNQCGIATDASYPSL